IFQMPGSNALDVANAVKRTMAELSQRFPPDFKYSYGIDTTLAVTEGLREILLTLGEALILVVFVVYLFLQNWRATLIPMVAVPISGMISAFNALTLSPALAAMLLRSRRRTTGLLGRFFGLFNRWFARATHGYVNVSHGLIRKAAIGVALLAAFTIATGGIGR